MAGDVGFDQGRIPEDRTQVGSFLSCGLPPEELAIMAAGVWVAQGLKEDLLGLRLHHQLKA